MNVSLEGLIINYLMSRLSFARSVARRPRREEGCFYRCPKGSNWKEKPTFQREREKLRHVHQKNQWKSKQRKFASKGDRKIEARTGGTAPSANTAGGREKGIQGADRSASTTERAIDSSMAGGALGQQAGTHEMWTGTIRTMLFFIISSTCNGKWRDARNEHECDTEKTKSKIGRAHV